MTIQTPPELFKNAAIGPSHTDAEEFSLLDTKAHPLAYDVQDILKEILDMDQVFVKGGAVRNVISGHEVDEIDVIFDVTQSMRVDPDYQEPEEMLRTIMMAIKLSGEFEDCVVKFDGMAGEEPVINMMGKYKGMDIDLNLVTHTVDLWTLVHDGCPPILSTIMDENGDCWAAPEFQEHLEAEIIVIDDPYHQNTFRKEGGKCDKYGWKCMGTQEAQQYLASRKRDQEQTYEM